jgi:hypothetical protein
MLRSPVALHRTILVVDVEHFSDPARSNLDRLVVRDGMYRSLAHAFLTAGIPWSTCDHEDRGDGVLVMIPPTIAKSVLIESMLDHLVSALTVHNQTHSATERIRLRMALHAGEIHYDNHGVVGRAIDYTFRLLDTHKCKLTLARSTGVLAVITSSWFFEEVIWHSQPHIRAAFQPTRVRAKETDTTAWICIPSDKEELRRPTAPSLVAQSRTVK